MVEEYKEDPIYTNKSKRLCEMYSYIRRVRPDGNCFFRGIFLLIIFQQFYQVKLITSLLTGFGFSYFQKLLGDEEEWKRFQALVLGTKDQLLSQGFPKFTLEDFYDNVTWNVLSIKLSLHAKPFEYFLAVSSQG